MCIATATLRRLFSRLSQLHVGDEEALLPVDDVLSLFGQQTTDVTHTCGPMPLYPQSFFRGTGLTSPFTQLFLLLAVGGDERLGSRLRCLPLRSPINSVPLATGTNLNLLRGVTMERLLY